MLAPFGSAHGYLGVPLRSGFRRRSGPACWARTKSAPPRYRIGCFRCDSK